MFENSPSQKKMNENGILMLENRANVVTMQFHKDTTTLNVGRNFARFGQKLEWFSPILNKLGIPNVRLLPGWLRIKRQRLATRES